MIPQAYVLEWRETAPWQAMEMVEQDLMLSRVLLEIFSSTRLRELLAFRGGTALHKLHFNPARRYSEDIDLVQIQAGPIGGIFDEIQALLNPWLGKPLRDRGPDVANLIYRNESEFPPSVKLRLKVEINTREHFCLDGYVRRGFNVNSRWFSGDCTLTTYSLEELLGTKMRALFQRRKGRDLFDLWLGLTEAQADPSRVVHCFQHYMQAEGNHVTRTDFTANLADKLQHPGFPADIYPLLLPGIDFQMEEAAEVVSCELLSML